MTPELTYKSATRKAKSLRAVGMTEIYLHDTGDEPWHLVTSCEDGGSHRLDIATSVWFLAKDPKTGLTFRWNFDIEPHSANGKGSYEIDAPACRAVLEKLNGTARKLFREYLGRCAEKVQAKADEWQKITSRQQRDAQTLRQLANALGQ